MILVHVEVGKNSRNAVALLVPCPLDLSAQKAIHGTRRGRAPMIAPATSGFGRFLPLTDNGLGVRSLLTPGRTRRPLRRHTRSAIRTAPGCGMGLASWVSDGADFTRPPARRRRCPCGQRLHPRAHRALDRGQSRSCRGHRRPRRQAHGPGCRRPRRVLCRRLQSGRRPRRARCPRRRSTAL